MRHHVLGLKHASYDSAHGDSVAIRDDAQKLQLGFGKYYCGPDSGATDVNVDFAAAEVVNAGAVTVKVGEVQQIGKISGKKAPKISFGSGGPVRKVGARTGLTDGEIVGIDSGKTEDGKIVRHVYEVEGTSKKYFGCPGDSGSAVIDKNGYLLGILSWGDAVECGEKAQSYFWAFDDPWRAGIHFSFDLSL